MFEWLQKKRNQNTSQKRKIHFITAEADQIINSWLKANKISIESLDDLLNKLNLTYSSFSEIKKKNISISDKVWETPGYIGSIEFEKEIFTNYNCDNKFAKRAIEDANQSLILNHTIHLCENTVIVEINYSYSDVSRNIITVQYKEFFNIVKQENGNYSFVKQKDENNVKITYYSYLYSDGKTYKREQIQDGLIQILLFNNSYTGPKKMTIQLSQDINSKIEFPVENILIAELWFTDFNNLSEVLEKITRYCENNNIDISSIKITSTDGNNFNKDLIYVNDKNNNLKNISLLERTNGQETASLKSVNVYNSYENDLSCRTIEVSTVGKETITLKVYYNSEYPFIPNENKTIYYLLSEYFKINSRNQENTDALDIHFENISQISFFEPSDNLQKVELIRYKNGKETDSKIWKRYNFEEDAAVLRRK